MAHGLPDGFSLTGKVALVTGAGAPVGRAIALALAEAGAAVGVAPWLGKPAEEDAVRTTAEQIEGMGRRTLALVGRATDPAAVEGMIGELAARLGGLDIVVCYPDAPFAKPFVEVTDMEWRHLVEGNLTGAFVTLRAAGRALLRRGGGRIITVLSMLGVRGMPHMAAYGAVQGGLVQLVKALGLEWVRQGIRVNGIGLGWFNGDPSLAHDPAQTQQLLRYVPMGRTGQPDDVGVVAVYLASDASTYMVGQTIFIDGGVLAHA